ncbi:MAG TPA: carboxymuconolactone decarboxylase family protein [Longimicrobiales bacterium]|nr:carboxymuconolactone decarboxylase family protein [Longimicrobiales bacterium]
MSRASDFGDAAVLSRGTRLLVAASAAIGAGRDEAVRDALKAAHAALGDGLDATAIEEMLLQTHLFVGYPATIAALAAWREIAGVTRDAVPDDDPTTWQARGEEVCRSVYGNAYDRLRAHVASLHRDLDRWMLRDGYGRVLGRPGLALRDRELCVVALLCGQDAEPQLYSHLRGALRVGATEDELEAVLRVAGDHVSAERREGAWRVWSTLLGRAVRAAEGP